MHRLRVARGNGLAFGATAGTLPPAADRPFARPRGGSHGARATASRALRGPSGRPAAALDPVPAPWAAIYAAPGVAGACRPAAHGWAARFRRNQQVDCPWVGHDRMWPGAMSDPAPHVGPGRELPPT